MRFTWQGKEFDTPDTREGLLGGFGLGELRWLKKQLKVAAIEQLDAAEARIAAFFLTIRRHDHTLLPIERWDDLAMVDFELVAHVVTRLDQDGDCGECHQPVDASLHLQEEAVTPVPTTPAAAPGQPTETSTT
jgi:hypothetical protein